MNFFYKMITFGSHNIKINRMKVLFYGFAVMLFMSCANSKDQAETKKASLPTPHINCPENGDCTFEVLENSVLNIKHDDNGQLYPEIAAGDQLVVKYTYDKKTVKGVMDGNYTEYVYFEFNPNEAQYILKDKELQKAKMLFGRICYCKGSMGYFPVLEGNLFMFNRKGNLHLRTSFKVHKVPQVIEQIDENIKF